MAWLKYDDHFSENPLVAGLSDGAFRAHFCIIEACGRGLTDGHVFKHLFEQNRHSDELLSAGLYEKTDNGYRLLDWRQHLMSQELAAKRRKAGLASARTRAGTPVGTPVRPRNPLPVTRDPKPGEEPLPGKPGGGSLHRAGMDAVWAAHQDRFGSKPSNGGGHWGKAIKTLIKAGATEAGFAAAAPKFADLVADSGGKIPFSPTAFASRYGALAAANPDDENDGWGPGLPLLNGESK